MFSASNQSGSLTVASPKLVCDDVAGVDVHHLRRLDGGVDQEFVGRVEGMVDLEILGGTMDFPGNGQAADNGCVAGDTQPAFDLDKAAADGHVADQALAWFVEKKVQLRADGLNAGGWDVGSARSTANSY